MYRTSPRWLGGPAVSYVVRKAAGQNRPGRPAPGSGVHARARRLRTIAAGVIRSSRASSPR